MLVDFDSQLTAAELGQPFSTGILFGVWRTQVAKTPWEVSGDVSCPLHRLFMRSWPYSFFFHKYSSI